MKMKSYFVSDPQVKLIEQDLAKELADCSPKEVYAVIDRISDKHNVRATIVMGLADGTHSKSTAGFCVWPPKVQARKRGRR